jgi:hypothetical protein
MRNAQRIQPLNRRCPFLPRLVQRYCEMCGGQAMHLPNRGLLAVVEEDALSHGIACFITVATSAAPMRFAFTPLAGIGSTKMTLPTAAGYPGSWNIRFSILTTKPEMFEGLPGRSRRRERFSPPRQSRNPVDRQIPLHSAAWPLNSPARPPNSAAQQRGEFRVEINRLNYLQGRV